MKNINLNEIYEGLSAGTYVYSEDNLNRVKTIIDSVNYVSTNQGSIWLTGNDNFSPESFYIYSEGKNPSDVLESKTIGADEVLQIKSKYFNV